MIPELRQTLPFCAGRGVAFQKNTNSHIIQESTYAICIRD